MRKPAIALLLASATLASPGVLAADTLDIPPRKAGLWEVTTVVEKPKVIPAITSQICLDASTDRELLDYGLQLSGRCKTLASRHEGKSLVIDAECTLAGKPAKTRTVITGDLQSAYTLRSEGTIERGGDKPPQSAVTTQTGTWKSADCPGMKPGDMTMFGGVKVNIKQMRALSGLIR